MPSSIRLKILRQAHPGAQQRWDSFDIPYQSNLNVIAALIEVQKSPITIDGHHVAPPTWDAACLEEVCGSCTMNVNGRVRQACTALVEDVGEQVEDRLEIKLEPMTKFPVVRDLCVDRSKMFDSLKRILGWVPIDGSFDRGMAAAQDDGIRQFRYALSRCMTCGCCVEACPQVNNRSAFIGPAAIGQALLFNLHPVGKRLEPQRLDELSSESGVTGCGNAQNCVKVCPKGVPLTTAIAQINRDTTVHRIKRWIGLPG